MSQTDGEPLPAPSHVNGDPGGHLDRLSAAELARMLGVSRSHVWELQARGKIPEPRRLGRAVRWDLDEVRAWLAAGAPHRDRWEAVKGSTSQGRA